MSDSDQTRPVLDPPDPHFGRPPTSYLWQTYDDIESGAETGAVRSDGGRRDPDEYTAGSDGEAEELTNDSGSEA